MKRATLIVIHPDGRRLVSNYLPSERPSYDTLRELVGGLIQPCGQFMEGEAYCNEEFLVLGMAPNLVGSRAVKWPVGELDIVRQVKVGPLHGVVVILEGFEEEEE